MRKILLVAVVLSLFVFPASAGAQEVAPLWHCDSVSTPVAGNPGWNYTATGAGAYWRTKQVGGSVVGVVQTSPAFTNMPIAESVQYQVQAADAQGGPWSNNAACVFTVAPLAVIIDEFEAQCIADGVRLAWAVNTEAFSTSYTVARDGDVVLNVPAACPGCTAGASYSRDVALPDASGVYTLTVWNGAGLIDFEEVTLGSCAPPTAVRLSRFSAR